MFLADDPKKRTKEIRHKSWLSIVTNRFTRAIPSEYTFFVILRYRLRGPRCTLLRNHTSREQVHPNQQLRVLFERSRQKNEYDPSPESKKSTLLVCYLASQFDHRGFIYLFYSPPTLPHTVHTSIQTPPVKLRPDSLVSLTYTLVAALLAGMIMM